MDIQRLQPRQTPLPVQWTELLKKTNLRAEDTPEVTVLVWDGDTLAATGSRSGTLLQYLAVDPAYQGEDLTATVLTQLRQDAFRAGAEHLFLCTKPANRYLLQGLFFYPVAQTRQVLLMEDRQGGLQQFLAAIPRYEGTGTVGALVMNCDPFTLGHRYVIEQAAKDCGHVYVFVLSEDRGHFPAADRLALVRSGTAHLANVTVLPSGPYMISAATFPTYFLPDRDSADAVRCGLDVEIFAGRIAPALGITRRYVGSEPFSAMTEQYNRALKDALPVQGIEVREVPRLCVGGMPVSATTVRACVRERDWEGLRKLVPETTLKYLNPF